MTGPGPPGGDAGRALYALEPGAFTAARNDLAKRLRAAGDKAEAALVAKLRRPPPTAWALNSVARQRPGVIDAVLDAGAGLRAATEDALAGDASALRTAQAWERRAVDAAVAAGAEYLSAAGHGAGDAPRQRMAGTLRAAMVDEAVAASLRQGVLDDDREAPGFGLDAFTAAATGSAAGRRDRSRAARPGLKGDGHDEGTAAAPTAVDAKPDERRDEDAARRDAEQAAAAAVAAELVRRAEQLSADADRAMDAAASAREAATRAAAEAEEAAARAASLTAAAESAESTAAAARQAAVQAAADAAAGAG